MQTLKIPCVLMRGGTSRGPFFLASDLPRDPRRRDAALIGALGAGHELQVDGIGGGNPLTSKVAVVGPCDSGDADVDYLFAQVKVAERIIDMSANCGNMLSAVGPFAIEQGLVAARDGSTTVRVRNVNTGKIIAVRVATPGGQVTYDGDAAIDGVPGTAAPVHLSFQDAAGAKTGRLLPTGRPTDVIEGIEVTCIDAAMPLVVMRAADLGKTGDETPAALDADADLLRRMETIRVAAGARMGLGPVNGLVIPKPALIARPTRGGDIAARYFMPLACHKALAVTGGVGLAMACATPGTIAAALAGEAALPRDVKIEHPSGTLTLRLEQPAAGGAPVASVLRTARRIFEGTVYAQIAEAVG